MKIIVFNNRTLGFVELEQKSTGFLDFGTGKCERRSHADEVAWFAALLLFVAALSAYLAIRSTGFQRWHERVADSAFLAGMTALAAAVLIAAVAL